MSAAAELTTAYLAQRRRIERAALRLLGCPEAAADIAQDTWLRAATAAEPPRDPAGLLGRIARNLALDRLRRRRTEAGTDPTPLPGLVDPVPSPEIAAASRQRLAAVAAALNELPEATRTAFVLARLDGLSHREVAARLGVSVSMVEKHLIRALAHLRDRVSAEA